MSFTFPKNVEEQINDFAKSQNISPDQAALTLVTAALAATKGEAPILVRERHPELYDLVEQAVADIDAGKSTPWQ